MRNLNKKESTISFVLIFLAIAIIGNGEKWSNIISGFIVIVCTLAYQLRARYGNVNKGKYGK
jgi:hypothetical protein